MEFRFTYLPQFERSLQKLPKKNQRQILEKIKSIQSIQDMSIFLHVKALAYRYFRLRKKAPRGLEVRMAPLKEGIDRSQPRHGGVPKGQRDLLGALLPKIPTDYKSSPTSCEKPIADCFFETLCSTFTLCQF